MQILQPFANNIEQKLFTKVIKMPSGKAWVESCLVLLIEGGGVQELK
jgi:hypothetical protein